MSEWVVGEVARLSVTVTDIAGQPADPNTVTLKIKTGSGAVSTLAYPAQIARTGAGAYYCDVPLTERGRWSWRWETDAQYQGACQGVIAVTPSNI